MWWTSDEDISFLIEYLVEGEFVIPSSATATVLDGSGVAIATLTDVALATTTTSATLVIPATNNSVAVGKLFENRHIRVQFVSQGRTYQVAYYYHLSLFIPMTTSTDDVRQELGLERSEAPDRDIDLLMAYIRLREEYGVAVDTALSSGTAAALAINQAIAVKAALEMVNGLHFRVAIKMKAEDSSIERQGDFDVESIRSRLGRRLTELVDIALGTTTDVIPTLSLSTPTDVITGV